MNIVIGLVIIFCLLVSEMSVPLPVEDVWRRILVMLLTMMVVPGLAVFQVFVFKGQMQRNSIALAQHQSILRRISACHLAVWLAASLSIVWAIKWQNVVRGNWGLDSWPLLDELVIILPIVLSLVASWAVFYEIQKSLLVNQKSNWRDRLKYVSLRFRVYVAMVVVPIALLVLMRDLWPSTNSLTTPSAILVTMATLAGLLAVFPFAMLLVLRNHKIDKSKERMRLYDICRLHKLRVTEIRIWDTGNQIINAVVAGVFPGFRILMLSDALMRSFPEHEIEAIVKHEAGHVRLSHLPIRITFVLLPIIALAITEMVISSSSSESASFLQSLNSGSTVIDMLGATTYLLYVLAVVTWLSRNMEHEADLYAIGALNRRPGNTVQSEDESNDNLQTAAQSMSDALLRFAYLNPDQYNRRSLTHPSLRQRMDAIKQASASPRRAIDFRKRFVRCQLLTGCITLTTLPVLMLLYRFWSN